MKAGGGEYNCFSAGSAERNECAQICSAARLDAVCRECLEGHDEVIVAQGRALMHAVWYLSPKLSFDKHLHCRASLAGHLLRTREAGPAL